MGNPFHPTPISDTPAKRIGRMKIYILRLISYLAGLFAWAFLRNGRTGFVFNRENIALGVHGPIAEWLEFNRVGVFDKRGNESFAAPFPPKARMYITTGLTDPRPFALHGYDIFKALNQASPKPLASFENVLDFGVGAGRLARMFKGFRGRYAGVDVDHRNVAWVSKALNHVTAIPTKPKHPLPLESKHFDLIISVSVFSHMNEADHLFYLSELVRVAKPGAIVLLTIHGERALTRAETESRIYNMLSVPRPAIAQTRAVFPKPGYSFILQKGHLTTSEYDYGITFISEAYITSTWAKYFDVLGVHPGAIHDFQDIVVLRAR